MTLKSLSEKINRLALSEPETSVASSPTCLPGNVKYCFMRAMKHVVEQILTKRENRGHKMHDELRRPMIFRYIAEQCDIIFPIVPSAHFRSMMKDFRHICIPIIF